jgi:hypothetical protein
MEVNIESSPKTMLSLRPSDRPWKRSDRSWESKEHGPCLPTTIVEAVPLCFLRFAGVSLPKRTGGVGHRTSYIKTTRKYEHAIKSRSELVVNECILQERSVALDIGLNTTTLCRRGGQLEKLHFSGSGQQGSLQLRHAYVLLRRPLPIQEHAQLEELPS